MPEKLKLLRGKIDSIRITNESVINWFDNRQRITKSIPVADYLANLDDKPIRFVLCQSFLHRDVNVDAIAFTKREHGAYLVMALKQNQILYLNPSLHDRSSNPIKAHTIELGHVLISLCFAIPYFMLENSSIFGTFIVGFTVLAFSCCISGYEKLSKEVREKKEMRQKILMFYGLPIDLESKIFNKKWRYRDAIGVVDLFALALALALNSKK